jgi:hypothetical protein
MKIRPVGTELFHTDGHDETTSRFSQLCERRLKTKLLKYRNFNVCRKLCVPNGKMGGPHARLYEFSSGCERLRYFKGVPFKWKTPQELSVRITCHPQLNPGPTECGEGLLNTEP